MDRKLIEFLVKTRDGHQMIADAYADYIESLAPTEVKEEKPAVSETTFDILKFEEQTGTKLGSYFVAYQPNNLADKWSQAYNVLRVNNATIANRYTGQGYQFSYWLYETGKIYRQKRRGHHNDRDTAKRINPTEQGRVYRSHKRSY